MIHLSNYMQLLNLLNTHQFGFRRVKCYVNKLANNISNAFEDNIAYNPK